MTIAREEIFGPVIAVIPYEREADAVGIANDSEYGLYGSIFSYDDEAVWRIGRQLRTGNVAKNAVIVARPLPYGGFKPSGLGREGRIEGRCSVQVKKTVHSALTPCFLHLRTTRVSLSSTWLPVLSRID